MSIEVRTIYVYIHREREGERAFRYVANVAKS